MLGSCQGFVKDIATPVDIIADKDLYTEAQLPLLLTTIGGPFAAAMSLIVPHSAILSDEFASANGITSDPASPLIFNLDDGNPDRALTNNSWGALGGVRFEARNILDREALFAFKQDSNRRRLLFTGYFFLGITEHSVAAYFGIQARRGGGTLSGGPFLSSSAIHDSALAKFNRALQSIPGAYEGRLVNSYIARIHLMEGRYTEALSAATQGLQRGDMPFQVLYQAGFRNRWSDFAGISSTHTVLPHPRFRQYVLSESGEAGRIPLALGNRPAMGRREPYFIQTKFTDTSSIDLMTWQENALMLAELRLRTSNDVNAALQEVNRVRETVPPVAGAPALAVRTKTNLDSIYIERDKQFFGTGLRLLDQRRFNRWTQFSAQSAARTWYFLPIAQREFLANPNLQGQ